MQQSEYMAMMQEDDGTLGTADLIAAYEQGIDDLRSAVAGLTPEQALARPVPGKWSTVECVGHIADTEIFFTDRIVRTVAMDLPLLMSADETQYIGPPHPAATGVTGRAPPAAPPAVPGREAGDVGRIQAVNKVNLREKAFWCLHLIPEEAHRRGIKRMEQDLQVGPLIGTSSYLVLSGARP